MKGTLIVICTVMLSSAPTQAGRSIYRPYPGTTFIYDKSTQQKIHVIKIDLTNKKVRLRVTSGSDAVTATGSSNPMGPNKFALKRGCQLATNGSIGGKQGDTMWVSGLVKSYGTMWPKAKEQPKAYMKGDVRTCYDNGTPIADCTTDGLLALSADNQTILMHTVGKKSFPDHIIPDDYDVAAAGRPVIVWDGAVVDTVAPYVSPLDKCSPGACVANPRTAYGISKNKEMMIFVVVDGRQSGRTGLTTKQLGKVIKKHGAWWAYNLDGGGSSAMYIKGMKNMSGSAAYPAGIVNRPSDGAVRQVPLQIGIQIVKPYGHLKGKVFAGEAFTGQPLAGAVVKVAFWDKSCVRQVKTATTAADGSYRIDMIYAGKPEVTVSAPGHKPLSRIKLIGAGDVNKLSFGLAPTNATESSKAHDLSPAPSKDLVDGVAINGKRVSFSAIPGGVLLGTDTDPDFPQGGTAANAGLPANTHPVKVCTKTDAGVPGDAAVVADAAPAGGKDAGDAIVDAGMTADASAASASDGGAAAGSSDLSAGCGCIVARVTPAAGVLGALLLMLALTLLRRWRP